ncbi:MAG: hypothetical protein GF387_03375 [Candidatus Portnoybacteria bacterium]|nr:hypothetical protein [Candidatus Portnoybacteria bacterium]
MKKEINFNPKTAEEEYALLNKDDQAFSKTKGYLKPLILKAINHFDLKEENKNELFWSIVNDIPVAAEKYLENKSLEKDIKFSSYFTWYIGQKINSVDNLKRK